MLNWPGWNSLDTVSRIHSLSEISGIVLLALLVVAEAVTFKYSARKDTLTAVQQEAEKQRHDDEMARVHLETAQATAEAAKLGVSFGNLHDFVADQERRNNTVIEELKRDASGLDKARNEALAAAEGTKKTLSDMSDLLEKQRNLQQQMIAVMAPRHLSVEQQAVVKSRLSRFAPVRVDIITFGDTKEIADFGRNLAETLQIAGWRPKLMAAISGAAAGVTGVPIFPKKDQMPNSHSAASALAAALEEQQISSKEFDAFEGTALPVAMMGDWNEKDVGNVRVFVGAKP